MKVAKEIRPFVKQDSGFPKKILQITKYEIVIRI
jgi:hypothetical protein